MLMESLKKNRSPIQQVLILPEELDSVSNCPVIKCWHYNEATFSHDYIIFSITEKPLAQPST